MSVQNIIHVSFKLQSVPAWKDRRYNDDACADICDWKSFLPISINHRKCHCSCLMRPNRRRREMCRSDVWCLMSDVWCRCQRLLREELQSIYRAPRPGPDIPSVHLCWRRLDRVMTWWWPPDDDNAPPGNNSRNAPLVASGTGIAVMGCCYVPSNDTIHYDIYCVKARSIEIYSV